MLTRLQVSGFKNLDDVDIRFGPFNCIAGGNGVGKSNIFDAIQFLRYLADRPIMEAAGSIRSKDDTFVKNAVLSNIFHRYGEHVRKQIDFVVDMIIPKTGEDDLGQRAHSTFNFLRYSLSLALQDQEVDSHISVVYESLEPILKGTAQKELLFKHAARWRNAVIQGKRNVPFISTIEDQGEIFVNLHQDGGSSGKPKPFLARSLPRTVLSAASYASETPTVLLARREMQSWKFLQLEPSAMRSPDELSKFSHRVRLGSDGSNLPSTIYRLAKYEKEIFHSPGQVYTSLANNLSTLIADVSRVAIDRDEKRQLLTLQVVGRDGTRFPARSLSDGTLRFLALAVLELDYRDTGLICLEEPENGIHPDRIPAIIKLLQRIPVDPTEEDTEENTLRQVIINTHSPRVIQEVPENSLVYVKLVERIKEEVRYKCASVSALPDTWRTAGEGDMEELAIGNMLSYLGLDQLPTVTKQRNGSQARKVKERKDIQEIRQLSFDYED